jgi:Ni,Fe-hydrogenase maturation factor
METGPEVAMRHVLQLTPELACEIAGAPVVVFVDADPHAAEPRIEPVMPYGGSGTPLGHTMSAAEVVGLAQRLYGFRGAAYLCRVPAAGFEGEGLSPHAEAGARGAAELLRALLVRR